MLKMALMFAPIPTHFALLSVFNERRLGDWSKLTKYKEILSQIMRSQSRAEKEMAQSLCGLRHQRS
jgi:hypothetical protein